MTNTTTAPIGAYRTAAQDAKAWPFIEARRVLDRIGNKTPDKGFVLFQTGYGASGLPHIGTFGENARTSMVRRAFMELSDIPTKMLVFSDDIDGLRKVPENVPNRDMMAQHLGKPVTSIPDPFGECESFAHYNNKRMREFLDGFGFSYEFKSSTECYKSGEFDKALVRMFDCYDEIMATILPTLGEERQQTYSIFFPISPTTGRVLQVPIIERKQDSKTIVFEDENGQLTEVPVTGGHVKMQWKPDWALRWYAFDVDYEMYGKDLISSAELAHQFVKIMGGNPPVNFHYELFLDEHNQKISKSKGNGISLEQWLTYATPDSLATYMFNRPQSGKKLYFDVIPRAMDDYLSFVDKFPTQDPLAKLENPVWSIHAGNVPQNQTNLTFGILLNLAGVASAETPDAMWSYIRQYAPDATPENDPYLAKLVTYALRYYQDFVKPTKKYRLASDAERTALQALLQGLAKFGEDATAEEIQTEVYEIGKAHGFTELKLWFACLYEVLLGQTQGPRMGSFIKLYGVANTQELIREKLEAKAA